MGRTSHSLSSLFTHSLIDPVRIIHCLYSSEPLRLNTAAKQILTTAGKCWPCAQSCWGRPSRCGRSRRPPNRGCPVGCPDSDRWATALFCWSGTRFCWSRPSKRAQFCRACSPWGPPPSLSSTSTCRSNTVSVMGIIIKWNVIARQKNKDISPSILINLSALMKAVTF